MSEARVWNRDSIVDLIRSNDKAVVQAIKALYARQTADEQRAKTTDVSNGVGFNAHDARFLSDVAQALPKYGDRMTPKQIEVARKMLPKYWAQLLNIAETKGAKVDYKVPRAKKEPVVANVEQTAQEIAPSAEWGAF